VHSDLPQAYFLLGASHQVAGFGLHPIVAHCAGVGRAENVLLVVEIVKNRLLRAMLTVAQHVLALKARNAQRQAGVKVFAQLDLVQAVFGKQPGPSRKILAVQQLGTALVELRYFPMCFKMDSCLRSNYAS
jgi:hypothetical protein